jgi:hypothetical protein
MYRHHKYTDAKIVVVAGMSVATMGALATRGGQNINSDSGINAAQRPNSNELHRYMIKASIIEKTSIINRAGKSSRGSISSKYELPAPNKSA